MNWLPGDNETTFAAIAKRKSFGNISIDTPVLQAFAAAAFGPVSSRGARQNDDA